MDGMIQHKKQKRKNIPCNSCIINTLRIPITIFNHDMCGANCGLYYSARDTLAYNKPLAIQQAMIK